MKKIILLFCIALLSVSCCIRPWGDGELSRNWYVRNSTEQTLILRCPYSESLLSNDYEYREFNIVPMSEALVCSGKNLRVTDLSIDYIERCADVLGEDVSWQILSEDGVVLKTWIYSEREMTGQRFFDIAEWSQGGGGFLSTGGYCVFRIYPQDILLVEQ